MNPLIKFSKNWNNKLDNLCFTSIMHHDKTKYDYYHKHTSQVFDVFLEGKRHRQAKLISIALFKFGNIPQLVLAIDTGKVNYTENVNIFQKFSMVDKDSMMIVLLFEKV